MIAPEQHLVVYIFGKRMIICVTRARLLTLISISSHNEKATDGINMHVLYILLPKMRNESNK